MEEEFYNLRTSFVPHQEMRQPRMKQVLMLSRTLYATSLFFFCWKGSLSLHSSDKSSFLRDLLHQTREKDNVYKRAVATVSSAERFLQDRLLLLLRKESALEIIFSNAASTGNVHVLKWAYGKGCEPKAMHFYFAAMLLFFNGQRRMTWIGTLLN
jgi:hypothetical protein